MDHEALFPDRASLEVLILAPTGQDAKLLASALEREGIASATFRNIDELCARVRQAGAVLIAEEALEGSAAIILNDALKSQEPWSDVPIVVMTSGASTTASSARVLKLIAPNGSVTLIERPFRPITLISSLRVALRARARQYQVRQLLEFQKQATQARDEFISVASHELKTPLTALKMQTQLALRMRTQNLPAEEQLTRFSKMAETTHGQVDKLTRLVEDMLDAARITSGHFTVQKSTFDLSELVVEVVAQSNSALNAAGCDVHVDAPPGIVGSWDRFRIEQVIANLLSNAARYAPGTCVWITVARREGNVVITVRDAGPGIPDEKREKIFQRFERASKASRGTGLGLGLYICRKIVESHHGSIQVESRPGEGATFIVELPIDVS